MKNLNTYPLLTIELIAKNKKRQTVLLVNPYNGQGFEIKGDVADICIMFSGKRTLGIIIDEFKAKHRDVEYDIDEEVSKLLLILTDNKLIDFLESPIV